MSKAVDYSAKNGLIYTRRSLKCGLKTLRPFFTYKSDKGEEARNIAIFVLPHDSTDLY